MHNEKSGVYIQAKLMVIHTIGRQNADFAGALAPNFERSEKLLPIVYITYFDSITQNDKKINNLSILI